MQIAYKRSSKEVLAGKLIVVFGGFGTIEELFWHLDSGGESSGLDSSREAYDVVLCYDYSDVDSAARESTSLESAARTLEMIMAGYECCVLVAFSLGVLVASQIFSRGFGALGKDRGAKDRGARLWERFHARIAVNGTPLGIDECYGIHPRIYAHTMRRFSLAEFARALFGLDFGLESGVDSARESTPESTRTLSRLCHTLESTLDIDACKRELQSLYTLAMQASELDSRAFAYTHVIISARDSIFPPASVRAYFGAQNPPPPCFVCNAPHFVFSLFSSWGAVLRLCGVPESNSTESAAAKYRLESIPLDSRLPESGAVAARFYAARESYAKHARVQAHMRENLLRLLLESSAPNHLLDHLSNPVLSTRRAFPRIFEFGAGGGEFSELLQRELEFNQFVCNDINDFSQLWRMRLHPATHAAIFDMRDLGAQEIRTQEICAQRFDLIASNACLQWLDSHAILPVLARMLADSGVLLLGSFGVHNCYEIAYTLGLSLPYRSADSLRAELHALGLEVLHSSSEQVELELDNAREVFRHLQASGVNSLRGQWGRLGKGALREYERLFGGRLTYEPLYILAQKPR